MKPIKKDELFQSLGTFLKSKGVELKDGTYTERIRQGCNLLADTINATQRTVKTAKVGVDKKLDQLRQTIHEATAPKDTPAAPAAPKTKARKPVNAPKKAPAVKKAPSPAGGTPKAK